MALKIQTKCVSLEQTRQYHFDISLTCSRHGIAEEFFSLGGKQRSLLLMIKNLYQKIIIYISFLLCYPTFLLENRDFLGFRMIFKITFNQIFANFHTMLYTIEYRLSLIMVYFPFTVHKIWPFFSQKIGTFQVSGCYLRYDSTKSVQTLTRCDVP